MTGGSISRPVPSWGYAALLAVASVATACGRPPEPESASEWIDPHRFSYLEPMPRGLEAGSDEQLQDQLAYLRELTGGRPVQPELDAETCERICQAPQEYEDDKIHLESCQYATVAGPSPRARRVVVCNGTIEGHWKRLLLK